ncbi:formate dehydrogenase subunit gamma [Alphaproteobacteria bacterium]|jgi:formate dehydrogenase subunit gamma|nr:formate dehydrogenase subunit gamma [Alphaproteobacteria bacterium]MDB9869559.1 formate dehydrogenase subunit gamma [Alphaproteobacteria bacterium]MDB9871790.1 formate dehydrogenase subunit gamma [Alphaproteobacteria bacterium]MDC1209327.1 formate dehydrogenase subunit gamma [Pseudomonadota bacterium]|tara:strand:+ start:586 stop:1623 length:1038 start_codon:yes stop_codon:yes gene_type:complete
MLKKITAVIMMVFILNTIIISNSNTSLAQTKGEVPGKSLGIKSDTDLWKYVRNGNAGTTQMKDELSAVMIQSEGDNWRALRNGPVSMFGGIGLAGIIALLFVFFLYRGKIKVESGLSGDTILRFATLDRFAHWLMAGSFVLLALTGLNILYGRYVLIPILGPELFSSITVGGKYIHNYLSFAFMIGLALAFILWVKHNIPTKIDWQWLKMGGGIFKAGMHPPAKKFNAGQKMIFWITMIGGLSVSMSGIALMFPFETSMFSETFALLNIFGLDLPTNLTAMQEQQYNQLWHGVVSLGLMIMIIAHIYIGSVGMEGALDAMNSGKVDRNWAKEHHNLWVKEEDEKS